MSFKHCIYHIFCVHGNTCCFLHADFEIDHQFDLIHELRLIIYKAYILPSFDYCDVVWNNCTEKLAMKLERLQNYAGRIILKDCRVTSATSIRRELHWLTLKEQRHLHIATLMFKVINKLGPDYLAPLCTPASKVHKYDTRAAVSGVLHLPRAVTNFGRKAFSFCGPKIWNTYNLKPDSYKICMLLLFLYGRLFRLISHAIIQSVYSIYLSYFAIHACLPLLIY